MTKDYEIIQAMLGRLQSVTSLKGVGVYPDEYKNIVPTKLPYVLLQVGNASTQFRSGRRNYNRVFINLYLFIGTAVDRMKTILELQDIVINKIITDMQYDGLVSNIFGYTVQTGDITDFISPTTTGYNGAMSARKITFDVQYYTCGVS